MAPAIMVRRVAALAVVAAVVLAALGVWALQSEAAGGEPAVEATVVVAAGETVWDIAAEYAPAGQSTHAYVAEVLARNDVDPAAVTPGTVLHLPRS